MMKTIALRFGETFSPEGGTIKAHQEVIDSCGYVWYGKLGRPRFACGGQRYSSAGRL